MDNLLTEIANHDYLNGINQSLRTNAHLYLTGQIDDVTYFNFLNFMGGAHSLSSTFEQQFPKQTQQLIDLGNSIVDRAHKESDLQSQENGLHTALNEINTRLSKQVVDLGKSEQDIWKKFAEEDKAISSGSGGGLFGNIESALAGAAGGGGIVIILVLIMMFKK